MNVQPGAEVAEGDVLLILEAMKMETEVRAARGGVEGRKTGPTINGVPRSEKKIDVGIVRFADALNIYPYQSVSLGAPTVTASPSLTFNS